MGKARGLEGTGWGLQSSRRKCGMENVVSDVAITTYGARWALNKGIASMVDIL